MPVVAAQPLANRQSAADQHPRVSTLAQVQFFGQHRRRPRKLDRPNPMVKYFTDGLLAVCYIRLRRKPASSRRGCQMRRREFVGLIGCAAAWPLAARAQQDGRVRRIGVLTSRAEGDPYQKAYLAALWEALARLGWVDGRNLRIDIRFPAVDLNRIRASAAELVSLAPDVILTSNGPTTDAVRQQTQTISILFVGGGDPVVT